MRDTASLKSVLQKRAKEYADTWQRLPESLSLPEPLPVISILHRYEGKDDKHKEIFATPQAAIQAALERGADVVLVEAGPGQGKTSALLWAAYLKASALASGDDHAPDRRIPWFKSLGELTRTGDAQTTLEGILAERPKAMRDKPGLLYLDGLDLLTSQPDPASLLAASRRLAEDDGHALVLSGRPLEGVRGALDNWGISYRIELAGLDQDAVDAWLGQHTELQPALDQLCQTNSAARDLRNTPLLFAMAVSAAIATAGGQEPLACNAHPGRAGLFAGFLAHFLTRAIRQGHLLEGYQYKGEALEALCWVALVAGHMEEVPGRHRRSLMLKALGEPDALGQVNLLDSFEAKVEVSVSDLRQAGIILKSQPDGTIRFIHQEFMEHLGGRHLARRLELAIQKGWLQAELWDHLTYQRLDNLFTHGMAQMGQDRVRAFIQTFALLSEYSLKHRTKLLAPSDPALAVDLVVPYCTSHPPPVRQDAAWALGRINEPRAIDALQQALKDPELRVRWAAAMALGEIKDPRAFEPLRQALGDQDEEVRGAAAWSLGEIKDPRAFEVLRQAMGDQDGYVRRAATWALSKTKDPRAFEPLRQALEDPILRVRWAAAMVLGEIKDPRAFEPLRQALGDQDEELRGAAAIGLGIIKDPRALEPLQQALGDRDGYVRWAAARSLGKIKDPRAFEPLRRALEDQDEEVRRAAARALGMIKDPRAFEPLRQALEDPKLRVRGAAARSLGKIKDPRAFEPLRQALGDQAKKVRWAAATVLGEIKDPRAFEPLRQAMGDQEKEVRGAATWALGEIKDPRAFEVLRQAMGDQEKEVRLAATWALGKIKDPRAFEPLRQALGDQEKEVRGAAATVLGEIKDPRAFEPLRQAMGDQEKEVRGAATWALGEIKDPRAFEPLRQALGDQDEEVRGAAARALGAIWRVQSSGEPMQLLLAVADRVTIDNGRDISSQLGCRWLPLERLPDIQSQRLIRTIKERSMSKGGDTINMSGSFHGPTVGKMEGNLIYNDSQVVLQALATLMPAFQQAPNVNHEVVAKLEEMAESLRKGNQPGALKGLWGWVKEKVDIADLPDYASKAWELLSKSLDL